MLTLVRTSPVSSRAGRSHRRPDAQPAVERPRTQCSNGYDRALYTCSDGFAFFAVVSTSVSCPHCGEQQAW